jgi:hypothetical protein
MKMRNFRVSRRELLRLSSMAGITCILGDLFGSEALTSFDNLRQATSAVDHLVLGVADLDQGMIWIEKLTGVKAVIGGTHPGAGTRNALLSFGNRQYLEILGPDPAQDQKASRFGDLRQLTAPRLLTWAVGTKEIDAVARAARAAGYKIDGPRDGSRARPDGKLLRWKSMSIINELGGVIPFFIEWGADVVHPSEDSPQGCKLTSLQIEHPEPQKVSEMLKKLGIEAKVGRIAEAKLKAVITSPRGKVELGY